MATAGCQVSESARVAGSVRCSPRGRQVGTGVKCIAVSTDGCRSHR